MSKIEDMPKIKLGKAYWTTADGKKIEYKDLTDDHLKNIIRDGYRNNQIYMESIRRGFDIPTRMVDNMKYSELMTWLESFASCAIEGNVFGANMTKLWSDDKPLFLFELNRFLAHTAESEKLNDFRVKMENNT